MNLALNQLIDGWHGTSLEEIKPLLATILKTTNRVNVLIEEQKNQQLQFSINQNATSRVNLFYLLQYIYLENLPLAKSRSLGLHYQVSPEYLHGTEVIGSEIDLGRMLSNLLQNAINYTESGDIFLRLLNQGDDLAIEVEDTGIGIAPENLENIFRPLWRSPDSQGSGLGLYVVKSVAITHDLKLIVDSKPGKGTKFTVVFLCQLPHLRGDGACN
ncbi:MAG: sensor histidine kinase [Gloeotrichia echinulata HAB0833]